MRVPTGARACAHANQKDTEDILSQNSPWRCFLARDPRLHDLNETKSWKTQLCARTSAHCYGRAAWSGTDMAAFRSGGCVKELRRYWDIFFLTVELEKKTDSCERKCP